MTRSGTRLLWTVVLALLTMTGGGLASCGYASPSPTAKLSDQGPTVTVPVDLPVTLSIAGRFANRTLAVLDDQIAAYEAANPGVRIELVRTPRDPVQRRAWVAARLDEADTSIDIYVLDATWPADLAAEGGLISLSERLETRGPRPETFLAAALEANSVDGTLMALPWTADSGLLYYRSDLLDRYNEEPPASWDELQRSALNIKAQEPVPHGFVWSGAADEDLTCTTLEHFWSRGPDEPDVVGNGPTNRPQIREALEQMKELVDSGASPQDVATYDRWAARAAFRKGEAVFLRDWFSAWEGLNGGESSVAGQTGLAPLPAGCLGGQSLGLSTHTLHPDRAFQFMTFLTGYEQQVQLAISGGQLPTLEAVYDDQAVLGTSPILEVVHEAFSVAEPRPSGPGYAQISEIAYTEVNRMLADQQDVATTAENIVHYADLLLR